MPRKKERPPRGGLSEQALFNIRLRKDALRLPIAGKAEAGKAKRIIAQIEASGTIAVTEIRSVEGQFGCSIQDVFSSGPFLRNTRLRGGSLDQDT